MFAPSMIRRSYHHPYPRYQIQMKKGTTGDPPPPIVVLTVADLNSNVHLTSYHHQTPAKSYIPLQLTRNLTMNSSLTPDLS